jgi:hypothetical protein
MPERESGVSSKFVAALAAFEDKDASTPSSFLNVTPKRNSAGVRKLVSRAKSAGFRAPPLTASHKHREKESELSRLTGIIHNLRKVGKPDPKQKQKPPPDKSDQQAREILKMLAQPPHISPNPENRGTHDAMQAKELMEILANLVRVGALKYKMHRKETEALEDVIKRLRKVSFNFHGDEAKELDDIIGKLETIGTDQEVRGCQVIEDAMARLKKATPKVGGPDKDELEDIEAELETLRIRMSQREEEELAEAIRNLRHVEGSGSDADDLARVLKDLQLVGAPEAQKAPSTPKSSKPSREESDTLKMAIQRFKKVQMTRPEAEAVAMIVVILRKIEFPVSNDSGAQDESKEPPEIDQLRNTFELAVKADEVVDIIKGLRMVQISDGEADALADIIRSFGTGSRNFRDDLADAMNRLKKVHMNKKETATVSYVIRYLRKVTKDSPEMVAIEKVVRPERYDEVVNAIVALKKLNLTNQEASELADVIQEMGKDEHDPLELDLDEWDVGSISDISGTPEIGEMALNDSDDFAPPVHVVSHHKEAPLADLEGSMTALIDKAEVPEPLADLEGSMTSLIDKAEVPEPHKTIHAERHQWKHKKHWKTVQGDRRYRPKEQINTTVMYSSLSTIQKDRRRQIKASMNASLDDLGAGFVESSDDEDHNASWMGSKKKASGKKKEVR